MKSLHRCVIGGCTACLVLLGLAGTNARADNMYPLKKKEIGKQVSGVEQLREQVREREERDGGCG